MIGADRDIYGRPPDQVFALKNMMLGHITRIGSHTQLSRALIAP